MFTAVPEDLSYNNIARHVFKDWFRKANGAQMSDDDIATFRNAFRKALRGEDGFYVGDPNGKGLRHQPLDSFSEGFRKDVTGNVGMTTAVGLQGVPIVMPAQILVPFPTPLRTMLPRRVVGGRTALWRQLVAPPSAGWGSVPEASSSLDGRTTPIDFNEADQSITFKSIEAETFLTPEALFGGNSQITPGQDFNVAEVNSMMLLFNLFLREELVRLGGNITALGTPATPTASATQPAAGSGSLTASTSYSFKVAALSLQGLQNALSSRGAGNNGSDNLGETLPSAVLTLSTAGSGAGSDAVAIQWAAPSSAKGVAAYAVYAYTTTTVRYIGVSYDNTYTVTALGASTNVVNTANTTANAYDSDGLIALCTSASAGYVTSLNGAALTGDSNTGIQEFYTAFKYFYDTYRIAPDWAMMGSSVYGAGTRIITGQSSPGFTRFQGQNEQGQVIKGGMFVGPVLNEFGAQLGKPECERILHPLMPQGMVLFGCDTLGPLYPNSSIGRNLQVLLGWDYRRDEFAKTKRTVSQEMMDVNGALAVYAKFGLGAILNIGT